MCGSGSVRTEALIRPEQLLLLQHSLRKGTQNLTHAPTSRREVKISQAPFRSKKILFSLMRYCREA